MFRLCPTSNPHQRVLLGSRINMTLQLLASLTFIMFGTIQASVVNVPFKDAVTHGVVSVGVGAGTYSLLVDTASANTWVGAGQAYQPGPNSQDTGETVQVSYGAGSFSGEEFTDDVTLGSATVTSQSIGVASSSTGFNDVDGVLGLGPVDLTSGTTSGGGIVPTVTENLFTQGLIDANQVAISAEPSTSLDDLNGQITFGGVDTSKFVGDITYVPITSTSPASTFWGLDATFTYGSGTTVLSSTAGIVDHVTTLLLLASDGFQTFQQATGGVPDSATGLLELTPDQFSNLQSLFINIGGTSFEITANALIWPRAFNTMIGGKAGSIYLVVGDIGTPSGQGLDFTIGYSILKRLYSVFDTSNARIGIATTPFTYATTN